MFESSYSPGLIHANFRIFINNWLLEKNVWSRKLMKDGRFNSHFE